MAVIPTEGICNRCHLIATYECASSPGCGDAIEFQFFNYDLDIQTQDGYACSPDGNPVMYSVSRETGGYYYIDGDACYSNLYSFTRVVDSPSLVEGTQYNGTNLTLPLDIGVHQFEYVVVSRNEYFNQFGLGEQLCEKSLPVTISVLGTAQAANAGTDAILPCGQDFVTLSGNDPNLPTPTGATSSWSFVSGPIVPTISDVNQLDLNVSDLVPGVYTFRYTVGNAACGFIDDEVKVVVSNNPPISNAGLDDVICFGGRYFLNANNTFNAIGTWSVSPSLGITFGDVNDPYTYVEGMVANTVYTFTWSLINGCGSDTDDVVITTTNSENNTADAGPDICQKGNDIFNLNAAPITVAGATGLWQVLESSNTSGYSFGDATSPTTTFNAPGSSSSYTSVLLTWTVTSPGCDIQVDTLLLTHKPSWISDTPGIYYQDFCDGTGTTVTLDYDNLWQNDFNWEENYEGPAGVTFLTPLDQEQIDVSFAYPGEYVFYINKGWADCAVKDEVIVTVTQSEPAVSAGPDVVLCNQYSYQMQASIAPYGGAWFNIGTPGGDASTIANYTYSDPTDPNTTITFSNIVGMDDMAGDYVFVWATYPEEYYNKGCFSYDTVTITIVEDANARNDIYSCNEGPINLIGNAEGGQWTFVSGPTTPILISESANGQVVLYDGFSVNGNYNFEYTINSVDCGTSTDQMQVIIQKPESNAGIDEIVCSETVELVGNIPSSPYSVKWTVMSGGGGSFVGGIDNETTVSYETVRYQDTILFQYAVTVENTGCTALDTIQIIGGFNEPLLYSYTPINTCGINEGSITFYNLYQNTDYDLEYTIDGVSAGIFSFTSSNTGTYTLSFLSPGLYENFVFTNPYSCDVSIVEPILLTSPCLQNIGNYVWYDVNGNGIQEGTENGVENISVFLYEDKDMNGIPDGDYIETDTTSSDGFYLFENLIEGNYIVNFDISTEPDYVFVAQNQTNDSQDSDADYYTGMTHSIILMGGVDDMTIDAGLALLRVQGYTWFDADENGFREETELLLQGITVNLYDINNNMVSTTRTNQNGSYEFINVPVGEYYVAFDQSTVANFDPSELISGTHRNLSGETDITDEGDSDMDPLTYMTYSFDLNLGDSKRNIDGGFAISVLPVELTYFKGIGNKCNVLLEWATASEENNAYFIIEHSVNGLDYTPIYQVDGQGNSYQTQEYSFEHRNLNQARHYYRLKQVDFDGHYEYFDPIVVNTDCNIEFSNSDYLIYPNPSSDFVHIVKHDLFEAEAEYMIVDVAGKVLESKKILTSGSIDIDISNYENGLYMILLIDGHHSETFRVIKESSR